MGVMGVAAAAESLGMTKTGVRKAIARGKILATMIHGGRRGAEYAITDAEIARYRRAHRRPGHRRFAEEPVGVVEYDYETEGMGGT